MTNLSKKEIKKIEYATGIPMSQMTNKDKKEYNNKKMENKYKNFEGVIKVQIENLENIKLDLISYSKIKKLRKENELLILKNLINFLKNEY